jgi:hypothetical protein
VTLRLLPITLHGLQQAQDDPGILKFSVLSRVRHEKGT